MKKTYCTLALIAFAFAFASAQVAEMNSEVTGEWVGSEIEDAVNPPTQQSDTLYIATAAAGGSDADGDGSEAKPYESLYRAMDDISREIPPNCTIRFDIDTGTYYPHANLLVRLSEFTVNGKFEIVGKNDTIKTGLSFTRDGSDRFYAHATGFAANPSWNEYRGYMLYSPDDDTGYPIAHNDTTAFMQGNEWDSFTEYTEIREHKTIWDFSTENILNSNTTVNGDGNITFQWIKLIIHGNNQRIGNHDTEAVIFNWNNCYFDCLNSTVTTKYIINANKKNNIRRSYFVGNYSHMTDYRGFISFGRENNMEKCVIVNESKTFTTAYWAALNILGDGASVNSLIINNWPVGIRNDNHAVLELTRSVKFYDVGVAFRTYTDGATMLVSEPWLVSCDSVNYYYMSRFATSNVNYVITPETSYGFPMVSQRVPTTGGTWKGVSTQNNAIDTNIVWSPFDNILLRFPADDPSIYDLKVQNELRAETELIVRDTTIIGLIEEHGGGGSSYTFTDGLNESGGNVGIGGALTQDVTVTGGNSYTMYFGAPPTNRLAGIEVQSTGDILLQSDTKTTISDVLELTPRSSAPSSPTEGMIYVNSTVNHIYCYINSTWVQLD